MFSRLFAGSEEHHYFLEGQPEESIQMDNNFSPSFEEASETADNSTEVRFKSQQVELQTELQLLSFLNSHQMPLQQQNCH